ncbi:MAG: Bax inhibitor-1/YccA family protein [Anaerolineae bacterium]|nr:Bax inhibitor-1/YccA family protein [Anaerolineae bacterium]
MALHRGNQNWQQVGQNTFPSVDTARAIMTQVYLLMMMGLATTAGAAFILIETGFIETVSPLVVLGAFLVELGLVFWLSLRVFKMNPTQAVVLFFAYSALNGITFALLFLAYTAGSIVTAFVSASALFAAMSIVGATTKMDLTRFRTFFLMGLIGLLIAIVVNIFLASSALELVISVFGVLLFTGLTAYDTQRIGRMAQEVSMGGSGTRAMATRVSVIGALILYLDFVNLFIFMLRLVGDRR